MWETLPSWFWPAVAYTFGTGGPLAGFLAWLRFRKKDPIDYSTAQIANATAISSAATGVVDMMSETMKDFELKFKEQDARQKQQDEHSREQDAKIAMLEKRVYNVESIWSLWYADLAARWEVYKMADSAPQAPEGKH